MRLLLSFLLLLLLSNASHAQDTDADGLPDTWETNGVSVNGVFLDLPRMGADPLHRDLFVEVDWMVAPTHSHEPKPEALRKVIQAFDRSPVQNPDGTTGVHLHVDAGPDSVMNPVTGERWGELSGGEALEHQDNLGTIVDAEDEDDDYSWEDEAAIKAAHFRPERVAAFRYCVFAHNLAPEDNGTSGLASGLPGTDFLVTLGEWSDQVGTVMEQAGTFMHEFGHTIGLRHGGIDHINNKPNYLSVMNYFFQTAGLFDPDDLGRLDFSRQALPTLDEHHLSEPAGISPAGLYAAFSSFLRFMEDNLEIGPIQAAIDWNQNGVANEPDVAADINDDEQLTNLESFDDWSAVVYATGPIGQADPGPQPVPAPVPVDELDERTDDSQPRTFEVAVRAGDDSAAEPGQSIAYEVTVNNHGSEADTYRIEYSSTQGWGDFTGLPATLSLGPNQAQALVLTVRVPSGVAAGTEDETVVTARSETHEAIVDQAVIRTTVTAVAAPSVAGTGTDGGGCFVATAAYGSYLDPHVVTLRHFRDGVLERSAPGRAFVRGYYRVSPSVAAVIAQSSVLRGMTVLALTPVVLALEHPLLLGLLLLAALVRARKRR